MLIVDIPLKNIHINIKFVTTTIIFDYIQVSVLPRKKTNNKIVRF